MWLLLGLSLFIVSYNSLSSTVRDYFHLLLSHTKHTCRHVNDLSTIVKLTNWLLVSGLPEGLFTSFPGHLFSLYAIPFL